MNKVQIETYVDRMFYFSYALFFVQTITRGGLTCPFGRTSRVDCRFSSLIEALQTDDPRAFGTRSPLHS